MKNENNTQHTPGPYLVAYDETIKMWVVFYNQDRPDSLGERDFETGEQLSPIMCDQITVAQCTSKEVADLIASAPDLLKENDELKRVIEGNQRYEKHFMEEYYKMKAINAELLQALKVAKEHWNAPVQRKLQVMINNQIDSVIAKAEGKTLGVS